MEWGKSTNGGVQGGTSNQVEIQNVGRSEPTCTEAVKEPEKKKKIGPRVNQGEKKAL